MTLYFFGKSSFNSFGGSWRSPQTKPDKLPQAKPGLNFPWFSEVKPREE